MPSLTLVMRRVAGPTVPLPPPLPTEKTFASVARAPQPSATLPLAAGPTKALNPIAIAPCECAWAECPTLVLCKPSDCALLPSAVVDACDAHAFDPTAVALAFCARALFPKAD